MVFAYAHFPIACNVLDKGKTLEIKNFLGEKLVRKINALPGVEFEKKEEEKSIIIIF
jgi:large subunit ribosomal protein L9e